MHTQGAFMTDAAFHGRVASLQFTQAHDGGQNLQTLNQADIVLVGLPGIRLTDISIYLANKGLKVANIPLVPGVQLPPQLAKATLPLIIALRANAEAVKRRKNTNMPEDEWLKLRSKVDVEVERFDQLCAVHHWTTIDIGIRSTEWVGGRVISVRNRAYYLRFVQAQWPDKQKVVDLLADIADTASREYPPASRQVVFKMLATLGFVIANAQIPEACVDELMNILNYLECPEPGWEAGEPKVATG